MTTVPYRSPTYAQIHAVQRAPASNAAASVGVAPTDTSVPVGYAGNAGNPTLYTRNPQVGPGATSAAGRNVPWSAPSSLYGAVLDQTILRSNTSLEDSEDAYRRRAARVGDLERFVPVPAALQTPVNLATTDQAIRRAQWLPPPVRYPSVNLAQRTLYGQSDPNWRRSFTPVDYEGLWEYQKEAAAWRRRHAAQLAYLRCHPATCQKDLARLRYQRSGEKPLGT